MLKELCQKTNLKKKNGKHDSEFLYPVCRGCLFALQYSGQVSRRISGTNCFPNLLSTCKDQTKQFGCDWLNYARYAV